MNRPKNLTDEAFAERREMILRANRWIKRAAESGDAESAVLGLLTELHHEETRCNGKARTEPAGKELAFTLVGTVKPL